MTRRFEKDSASGLWTRRSESASYLEPIITLSAGRPIFTLDEGYYESSGGNTTALVDWNNSSLKLTQATALNQCSVPAAHADFSGKPCLTFAVGQYYQSNSASAFNFLHDGTGSSLVIVYTRTNTGAAHHIAASCAITATTNLGFAFVGLSGGNTQAFVGNGVSTVWSTLTGGVTTVNVPTYHDISYDETADAWNSRLKSVSAASGTTVNAPSVANSSTVFTLGAKGDGTGGFVGRIAAVFCFPYLSAGDRASVQQWINDEYGIAP